LAGTLYIVGTPIGNLGDFSPRGAQTLGSVDFIAAEDTRVTIKLLNHLDIKKPMISYFEHNKLERGEQIIRRLEAGESCALVTDAGMPVFSDPGEELVALCHERGIAVTVIPGPCAAVSAIAISGLPSGRFCFEGFLSVSKKPRREHLKSIADEERTLVFYEAPHKLKNTLADLYKVLGDRRIAITRELTKIHEEVINTTLSQATALYDVEAPRGEFVLIVEGKKATAAEDGDSNDGALKAAELASRYIGEGMSHSAAVKRAAQETGASRSEIYKLTL
jgi:16S rRNA (cytidine1402-2'-O)-methyltransferase